MRLVHAFVVAVRYDFIVICKNFFIHCRYTFYLLVRKSKTDFRTSAPTSYGVAAIRVLRCGFRPPRRQYLLQCFKRDGICRRFQNQPCRIAIFFGQCF